VCVSPGIEKLIDDFCKEKGNDKTKELLLSWLKIRRAKKVVDIEETVKENLEGLPTMAKQSNMSINEFLSYTIRKGWLHLYTVGEDKHSFRMMTGAEAGIKWEPDDDTDTSSNETDDTAIPNDILDMFGE